MSLRSQLIKLAYENPELREKLMPFIKSSAEGWIGEGEWKWTLQEPVLQRDGSYKRVVRAEHPGTPGWSLPSWIEYELSFDSMGQWKSTNILRKGRNWDEEIDPWDLHSSRSPEYFQQGLNNMYKGKLRVYHGKRWTRNFHYSHVTGLRAPDRGHWYVITEKWKNPNVAEKQVKEDQKAYRRKDPWGNSSTIMGLIRWADGSYSGLERRYHSGS